MIVNQQYQKEDKFMFCVDDDPQIWQYSKNGKPIFQLLHMAIIIMTSVQTERAFHSIPKKIGYYQTQDIKIVNEKVVT